MVPGTVSVMLSCRPSGPSGNEGRVEMEEGMRADEEGKGKEVGDGERVEEREMKGMGRAVLFACFLRIFRVASVFAC